MVVGRNDRDKKSAKPRAAGDDSAKNRQIEKYQIQDLAASPRLIYSK